MGCDRVDSATVSFPVREMAFPAAKPVTETVPLTHCHQAFVSKRPHHNFHQRVDARREGTLPFGPNNTAQNTVCPPRHCGLAMTRTQKQCVHRAVIGSTPPHSTRFECVAMADGTGAADTNTPIFLLA